MLPVLLDLGLGAQFAHHFLEFLLLQRVDNLCLHLGKWREFAAAHIVQPNDMPAKR